MALVYRTAAAPYVRDVWFDGNEEIVEIGATCPNPACRQSIVTAFTRPRVTSKTLACRSCGIALLIVRPAFGFETSAPAPNDT